MVTVSVVYVQVSVAQLAVNSVWQHSVQTGGWILYATAGQIFGKERCSRMIANWININKHWDAPRGWWEPVGSDVAAVQFVVMVVMVGCKICILLSELLRNSLQTEKRYDVAADQVTHTVSWAKVVLGYVSYRCPGRTFTAAGVDGMVNWGCRLLI